MKARRPPTLEQVQAMIKSNRKSIHSAARFFAHYEARKWRTTSRKPVANWKEELDRWIAREQKAALRMGH